jgi:hypothetical protein
LFLYSLYHASTSHPLIRAVAKKPQERFNSAGEMVAALSV